MISLRVSRRLFNVKRETYKTGHDMIDPSQTFAAARRLRRVMTATLLLTLGVAGAAALSGASDQGEIVRAVTGRAGWEGPPLPEGQAAVLAGIGLVHLGLWIALLLVARAVFARFAEGDMTAAAARARVLARLLWALFAWGIVAGALASVALSWHFPPGQRELSVGLGSTQVSLALAALVAGFVARAFALGADLWQDHRAVI